MLEPIRYLISRWIEVAFGARCNLFLRYTPELWVRTTLLVMRARVYANVLVASKRLLRSS